MVPADSHRVPRAPRYSGYRWGSPRFAYGPLTLCGRTFQTVPLAQLLPRRGPTTPAGPRPRRFGPLPVRSPLLGESLLFSFPAGTKMFQFPALASRKRRDGSPSGCRVVPFGDPRIKGRLRLPADFRSLPRPSSPPRAKASAVRPYFAFLFPSSGRALRRGHLHSRAVTAPHSACIQFSCLLHRVIELAPARTRPDTVENNGFEPLTPCLQSRCSSQLS